MSSMLSSPELQFKFPVTVDRVIRVAYAGNSFRALFGAVPEGFHVDLFNTVHDLDEWVEQLALNDLPDVLIVEDTLAETWKAFARKIRSNVLLEGLILIVLSNRPVSELRRSAMQLKVNDVYSVPTPAEDLIHRIRFLVKFKLLKPELKKLELRQNLNYKMRFGKRFFDIFCASVALLLLSPLFILIALLIKLESRGPVLYISKRVGTGYKIFDFYKFRTMRTGADKELETVKPLNNYDRGAQEAVFVKIHNDPRVTRFGHLLRKSSLDELPQLLNVLKGDMSLVGNRPLPLYEAELLTCNDWTMRFLAPAGVTGLWQINKNKDTMSSLQRKKLDNYYANHFSFRLDLRIMFSTIPAMWQREDA